MFDLSETVDYINFAFISFETGFSTYKAVIECTGSDSHTPFAVSNSQSTFDGVLSLVFSVLNLFNAIVEIISGEYF